MNPRQNESFGLAFSRGLPDSCRRVSLELVERGDHTLSFLRILRDLREDFPDTYGRE